MQEQQELLHLRITEQQNGVYQFYIYQNGRLCSYGNSMSSTENNMEHLTLPKIIIQHRYGLDIAGSEYTLYNRILAQSMSHCYFGLNHHTVYIYDRKPTY